MRYLLNMLVVAQLVNVILAGATYAAHITWSKWSWFAIPIFLVVDGVVWRNTPGAALKALIGACLVTALDFDMWVSHDSSPARTVVDEFVVLCTLTVALTIGKRLLERARSGRDLSLKPPPDHLG